mgnify:CR=1 FL=1
MLLRATCFRTGVLLINLLAIVPAASAAPVYNVTDLGVLPGSIGSRPSDLNNNGQIVGAISPGGTWYSFLYSGGTMTNIGTLPAPYNVGSFAFDVNNLGQVAGQSNNGYGAHAYLYSAGLMTDLGTLGGSSSTAQAINDHGVVVGWSEASDGYRKAFVYGNSGMQSLGTLAGGRNSYAYDINNSGQIVGWSDMANYNEHAVLYSGGSLKDLGTLGGSRSEAMAINDNGQIVGWARTASDDSHAFLYSNGVMRDLGLPGTLWTTTQANAINNKGQVVGVAAPRSGRSTAFLYNNGSMVTLNSLASASGWLLTNAYGINDNGWIVCSGVNDLYEHALLLTPIKPTLSVVSSHSGLRTVRGGSATSDSSLVTVDTPGDSTGNFAISSSELSLAPISGSVPSRSTAPIPFLLGWKDTGATGPKTGLVTLTNTDNSYDLNNHQMTVTGALVANRSLTVSSITGRVIAGNASSDRTLTIRSGGDGTLNDDNHETRVNTVASGTSTDGFVSAAYQGSPLAQFNGANQAADLSATFTASSQVGLHHGSLDLAPTMLADGEDSSVGATVQPANLNYDISVLANRQLTVDAIGGGQAARVVQRTRFVTAIHSGSDPAIDGDDAATRVNTVAGGRVSDTKQKLTVAYAGTPTGQFNDVDQSADVGLTFAKPGRYQGSLNLAPTMLANGEDASVGATVQPAVLNYNINVLEPRRLCAHTNHVQFGNVLRGATVSANYSVHSDNLLADAEHTTMVHVAPGGSALGSLTVGQTLIDAAGNVSVPITGTFDSYEKGVVRGLVPVATAEAAEVQDSTNYKSLKFSYSANVGIAHFGGRPTQFGSGATVLSAAVPSGGRMSELSSKISPTRTLVENATLASAVTSPRDLRGMYGAVGSEATIVDSTALASDATVSMQWRRRTQTEAHYQNRTDPALPDGGWLASDVVKIDGIADSVAYALQMTFDNRINLAIDGPVDGTVANEFAAGQLYLAEFDTAANRWLNAASLVTAGAEAELGVLQSLSDFMAAHVGASLFDLQGSWGVDPLTNDTGLGYAWVITAGSGIFAVDPSGTPATFAANGPGSAGLSAAGLGGGSLAGGMLGDGSLAATSPTAVPEPGTLALVVVAAVALSVFAGRRGKR